jgi:hypothetical protein
MRMSISLICIAATGPAGDRRNEIDIAMGRSKNVA